MRQVGVGHGPVIARRWHGVGRPMNPLTTLELTRVQIVEYFSINQVDRFVPLRYTFKFLVAEIIHYDRSDSDRFQGNVILSCAHIS